MDDLKEWFRSMIEDKKVEPNSGLGKAIKYMRKHWNELTLFLREPDAPLDNNICERALKKAILHRKNALFYKTERGAYVGDLFMSLIHTCSLCNINPFDYLKQIQKHFSLLSSVHPETSVFARDREIWGLERRTNIVISRVYSVRTSAINII
jgi:hypothetical protein